MRSMRSAGVFATLLMVIGADVQGQQGPGDAAAREALQRATAADHQQMMAQLGIRALRPGPSGDESAPNRANYDEATANPYPELPPVLTLKNGRPVTTADHWRQRRAEILEDFDREVAGRVPKTAPRIQWTVVKTEQWTLAGRPVVGQALVGRADNSSHPRIAVDIQMTLVVPADAVRPVPVMIMFGSQLLPSDAAARGRGRGAAAAPAPADPPATEQLIADGWGAGVFAEVVGRGSILDTTPTRS